MNKFIFIPLVSLLLLSIDTYVYQAVRLAVQNTNSGVQVAVKFVFWFFSALVILGILAYNFLPLHVWTNNLRVFFMGLVMVSVVSKLFMVVFLMLEDITRVIRWGFGRGKQMFTEEEAGLAPITRSEFLSQAAVAAGAIPAVAFTYGIISGAHDYRLEKVKLTIPNLPKSFHGLRIAQISDIHSGSFFNKVAVQGGVDMIKNAKTDLVFFTGDLVNNVATEVEDYFTMFSKIKAPLGVFSTLGNHDYGDYVRWESTAAKKRNLNDLMKAHELMGWRLLNDENHILEESGDKLAILGVQNIGIGKRFPWYGDMAKAYAGTEEASTKLLLSHDPTHWDGEVRKKYQDVDVAFAGHTHGTQFGVKIGDYRWSPAQYVYKQWAGLYKEGNQQLYVNRGFGYLGYPGRVGMPPEITVFELVKNNS